MSEEEIIEKLKSDDVKSDTRISLLLELSKISLDKDSIQDAFKYASMASVCSEMPRADVCCALGDLYGEMSNYMWSKIWFGHAMQHSYTTEYIDKKYNTWWPIYKLAEIDFMSMHFEPALQKLNMVLMYQPDNEEIKNFKQVVLMAIDKK